MLAPEAKRDDRGYFARAFCMRECAERGLLVAFVQANIAGTNRRGTIRGLHYQVAPAEEAKLVRCTRGAVWDVMVDMRPTSPTRLQWFGIELTAENQRQVYVPRGFAHGYQCLVDDSELFYFVTAFYSPDEERGIRWNDPALSISWPISDNPELSPKDRAWPDLDVHHTPMLSGTTKETR